MVAYSAQVNAQTEQREVSVRSQKQSNVFERVAQKQNELVEGST